MATGAVAALDVAAGRNSQVHSPVIPVFAAEAGMTLDIFSLIAAR
jgi:hypothetical protein